MIKEIIKQFQDMNRHYEPLIQLTEDIFEALKYKNFDQVELLNKRQIMLLFDLERSLQKLKTCIQTHCKTQGKEEFKLSALLPHMTVEEKEEVMACQRYAFTCEKKLKNNIKNNECLVQTMMAAPSILSKTYVELAKEQRLNGNSLLSRKF